MSETLAMTDLQPQAPTVPRGLRRPLLDSAYALTAPVFATPAFVLMVALLSLGAGTIVVIGGILLLALAPMVARGFGRFERLRMRGMLGMRAPAPAYACPPRDAGFWRRSLTPLRDPQSWLDVVWCLVGGVTAWVAFGIVVAWWASALGGLTYWFWQQFIPYDPQDNVTLSGLVGLGEGRDAESLLMLGIGAFALLTLPLAARLAALLHAGLAWLMLSGRADLQDEVARVAGTRDAAHRAEAASLRKLERDIHDGPQQRLIRLGMDIGRARSQVHEDPDRATATLDAALDQTRETVEELRALSRGIAPPLLVDRGLAVAVREMASGQAIPVDVTYDVRSELPQPVETAAYFVVAESLTNVAKHSQAARAEVRLVEADGRLVVTVDDDGRGGAQATAGRGLDGLRERLAGVEGTLAVASPDGGPTRVRAEVPLG